MDERDEMDYTPLRLAAVGGHFACVQAILERSDPDVTESARAGSYILS